MHRQILRLNPKLLQKCVAEKRLSTASITQVEFKDGVKKITMCDPKTRNSLSLAMISNLLDHIDFDRNNQDLRVIILAAQGPIFSAGHNLKELTPEAGISQQEKVFSLSSQLMCSIIDCPVPVIARVDGLAAASGCQLVAQCDIALCSDTSSFSTPGANLGLFCSTPGIPLARKVSKATALHMLLTGLPISAQEAKLTGLVSKVCPAERLDEDMAKVCEAIANKSRAVIELGKKFFYRQVDVDLRKAYELGGAKMVENLQIKDGKEGVRSFVEKRKPVWSHRID